MKKTTLFVCGSLLMSVALLNIGSVRVNAANEQQYSEDGTTGTGIGSIKIAGDDDSVVPKPDEPDTPVTPDNPNTNPGDLKIVYVPNFDFGTHKKQVAGITALANPITVTNEAGTKEPVVPFVTTKDMRTDRTKGWTLTCTSSVFTDATTAPATPKTIKGAYVSLEKASYYGTDVTNPVVANESIKLEPNSAVPVSSADTTKNENQGFAMHSLSLGTLSADQKSVTDGATFHLPANTAVDDGTYTANFVWTIAPTI